MAGRAIWFFMGKYEAMENEINKMFTLIFDNDEILPNTRLPVGDISDIDSSMIVDYSDFEDGLHVKSIISKLTHFLKRETGVKFRLPTEAEWEFACRERGKKVRFGNGKSIARADEINFDARKKWGQPFSQSGQFREKALPVGSFLPNNLGFFDMSGNQAEIVSDAHYNRFSKKIFTYLFNFTGKLSKNASFIKMFFSFFIEEIMLLFLNFFFRFSSKLLLANKELFF